MCTHLVPLVRFATFVTKSYHIDFHTTAIERDNFSTLMSQSCRLHSCLFFILFNSLKSRINWSKFMTLR